MGNFFRALGTRSMRKKVRKMAQSEVAYCHLEQLVKALDHDDPGVRWWAVEGLRRTGGSHPLPALIKAAADSDAEVVRTAVSAIGGRRWNSDDAPVLEGALLSSVPRLREAAADKLLELDWRPNEEQVRLLGAEFWVNHFGWEQCRVIGAPAMQGLLRLLIGHPGPNCVETLAAVGGEEAVVPLLDWLVDRLNDPEYPHLRDFKSQKAVEACFRALGGIGVSALQAVVEAAPRIKNSDKSELLRTLAFFTTPDAVEPLLEIVDAEGPGRLPAIESLGHIGDCRAVLPLITIIESRPTSPGWWRVEDDATTAAIEALGLLGDARAVEPLMALMRERVQAEWGCRNIVIALGRIGDHRACGPVADYVFTPPPCVEVRGEWDGKWNVDYPWRFDREALAGLFGEHRAAIMGDLAGRRWRQTNADEEAAWDRLSEDQQLCHPCPGRYYQYDYSRNFAALRLLCDEVTPISSNLLRRVAAHGVSPELKKMAKEELARRGNPAEDPEAW